MRVAERVVVEFPNVRMILVFFLVIAAVPRYLPNLRRAGERKRAVLVAVTGKRRE